ncbi:MAG: Flp family type IVb pilin [Pseudodesulfovibrio sp.]
MSITNLIMNEDGATALEYGLLAALIAVAIIGSVQLLSTAVQGVFSNAATEMNAAMQ